MKVKVTKKIQSNTNKQNTGVTIQQAYERACEVASKLKHFRVQAWMIGEDWPRASWCTLGGDNPNEVLKHGVWGPIYNADEVDIVKVIDEDSGKVVDTILVNG